jgi:single-strand DNA-binding protein
MMGFNRVVLVGNLTRDPQLRQIPSGASVAEMGLATNERYRNRDGETAETTCFVEIVAWGKQAETCDHYLKKGAPILVEGRLQFDQWKTSEGEKRSKLRVKADRVQFLGKAPSQSEAPAHAARAGAITGADGADEEMPF